MARTSYAIGLGSNRRGRHGSPAEEVAAAIVAIGDAIGDIVAVSPIVMSAPLGPSIRRFANAVAVIATDAPPDLLLAGLKAIERAFGRRRGRRWGARVIDLDILLWSAGPWRSPGLRIPHVAYRTRAFVLAPLGAVAPGWRDPCDGRTVRQLAAMVDHRRPRS